MGIADLAPAARPIGVYRNFLAQHSETLILKEKIFSLSGDSFSVKTLGTGLSLFAIKGEAFSLSGRKHLLDYTGATLFDIRKEHFSLHKTYYGEDAAGKRIFELKKKMKLVGSKAVCSFASLAGVEEELVMKGDFFDSRAEIVDKEDRVVALVDRKYFNARELVGGQQTYAVTVAPNVDMSIVIAMCVCLDELRNEDE